VLPGPIAAILSGLQKSAPAVDFAIIRRQIERELDMGLEEAFVELDPTACAAASIGQVHRGRLHDGRAVVVKVQYPGVEKMVESDLGNLRTLLGVVGNIGRANLETIFEEVRDRMREEVDYERERQSLELFGRALRDDPRVIIPRPIAERSSRRVLTMERVDGLDADALCSPRVPQRRRDAMGELLLDLVLRQVFELRMLHADPNLANYAFTEDGHLIVYDFGCVKRFSSELVAALARLLADAQERAVGRIPEDLIALGFLDPQGPPPEPELLRPFVEVLAEPFGEEPYSFGDARLHERLREAYVRHAGRLSGFHLPPQLVFFNRVLGGMYGNLRRLRARSRFGALLRRRLAARSPGPPLARAV